MNFRKFKAPYIPREEVWKKADQFRSKYWSSGVLPVNVDEIIEFDLCLTIRTVSSLRESADIDALLLGDLQTIVVDRDDYMDNRMQNRMRFNLAHERGHYVLHQNVFKEIQYTSVNDWIKVMEQIPDDQYGWIEQQAYEFAGRLLVPKDQLETTFNTHIKKAESPGFSDWDTSGDVALEYVASAICQHRINLT